MNKWRELRKQNKEDEYKALMKSMRNAFKEAEKEILTREELQKVKNAKN